jgi:hypothetical protein
MRFRWTGSLQYNIEHLMDGKGQLGKAWKKLCPHRQKERQVRKPKRE